ncbi:MULTISPECIES: DMSO/selenate family reductase complex A subunit [unclassified Brenneria]|uniref:DMSO/selenate family reductase complex A subunit n=1 Tax=unclassified Brenneria TaxID=2634434 RepID=UPI0015519B57|nr:MULTISPECIES: DMSO/selenate family reductase complex A subunit [unclassified Brenneria]MBJ7221306.1 molybdopterin-dependent oxidoreductase [Brenneria sp. L3-3C-1]MEE3642550.1 DMSO/selenate family reductase complex A subunit [Brenneria sp. L3_3C_1]MEE3650078.1 DMSO/selenate family reductase complex A subunit [Brenneria sp. HEZEL_4_2_4]NPD00037.1 molybdopterin-dependent oxidoreductase [Brenneria sp. hezel4-2-4]
MKKIIDELLHRDISRREAVKDVARFSAAVALSSSITLPFTASARSVLTPGAANQPEVVNDGETVRHSACLVNCGSRCPLKVIVKDDRIVRIEPEDSKDDNVFGEHQIRPCLRGRSNRWRVYSPDRLKYPMKRVGKRGEGKFKRISWEEATALVASELKRVAEKYGNEAIYYNYQSGAYYHNQGTPAWKRLLNLNGGYLNYHNTYSTAQIATATPYTHGTYVGSHFTQIRHSDLVVFFGMNLSETRMSGGGQVEELRRALEASHARVVIIDPRYTDSVITEHAEWLAIRPTTDAALVAGLAHTLISERLIDEALVNRYSVGYDRATLPASAAPNASYKDYILGLGEDGVEKTPEWAADITGIPAARIRQLARDIAGAKACYIGQGWGPQRHANGEQSVRAIQTLPLLTGHFGLPGTNNGNWPYSTKYDVPTLPTGANPLKISIPCYLWTDAILNPEKMTATTMGVKGADKLNVGIKLIVNQAGNTLVNQHGQINRTREILADDSLCETIIVIDNHMTASAKFADILLPETSYLEAEDLVDNSYASGSNHYMIAMQKTITPMWEVRSTYDICADIAEHLGMREKFTEGRTQAQWVEKHYQQVKEQRTYLPEWAVARNKGIIDQQIATDKQSIAFADFRLDPQANPLKTPSGKAEIYSEALAKLAGEWILPAGDKISPIPEFCPARESHLNKTLTAKYPLQLSGFHTKGHTHSTYSNVSQLHEAAPDEVWINPLDAAPRNLKSGDRVRIFNDRGIVEIACKVTDRILPGVAAMPQGAWTRINSEGVDIGGCINTLTTHEVSPLAKGNPQHTNLVEIQRV